VSNLLFFILLCSSVVFCLLLVSSLPQVGFGRTVWRSPPRKVIFLRLPCNCLFLYPSSIVPLLSRLLRPSLPSNRSAIVDRVTRGFLVQYLNALSNSSQYHSALLTALIETVSINDKCLIHKVSLFTTWITRSEWDGEFKDEFERC
jgi:hypothetical protein